MRKVRRKRIRREKHWIHCQECFVMETNVYGVGVQTQMQSRKLCFNCNFWYSEWQVCGNIHSVIRDGSAYYIGNEDAPLNPGIRGFDGRAFYLEMFFGPLKGRLVKTTNLWAKGHIPAHFVARMPNNAFFITADDYSIKKGLKGHEVFTIHSGMDTRVLRGHGVVEDKPIQHTGEDTTRPSNEV